MSYLVRTTVTVVASAMLCVACAQTDTGITTAVNSRLAMDDQASAIDVNVDTRDGVVTLSGTVESEQARMAAVRVARETDGVRDVIDNMVVRPDAAPASDRPGMDPGIGIGTGDTATTDNVKNRLSEDATTRDLNIDVETRNGVVTLSGTVRTQAEKDRALQVARETQGVTQVEDRLTVSPQ